MKQFGFAAMLTVCVILACGCSNEKKADEKAAKTQTAVPSASYTSPNAPTAGATVNPAQTTNTEPTPQPATVQPQAIKEKTPTVGSVDGKQIFDSRCSICHGQNGEGKATYPKINGMSKTDVLTLLKGYDNSERSRAHKMIMTGKAKDIDDNQKAAVADYTATLR